MSTKTTIAYDNDFHLYQELGNHKDLYLQIDCYNGELHLANGRLRLNISPELLTKIANGWIMHHKRFDSEPFDINLEGLISLVKEK